MEFLMGGFMHGWGCVFYFSLSLMRVLLNLFHRASTRKQIRHPPHRMIEFNKISSQLLSDEYAAYRILKVEYILATGQVTVCHCNF
jgi:hypothetical protein